MRFYFAKYRSKIRILIVVFYLDHVISDSFNRTKLEPSKQTGSWVRNVLIGYYLLEFSFWLASYIPSLIPTINRLFFKLVFSG